MAPDDHDLPGNIAYLIRAAGSAPSADNSQPWCFSWDGRVLSGIVRRRGGFPIDYHATLLALGAAAENLSWALTSLGLDPSQWHFGSPDADGVFVRGALEPFNFVPPPAPVWLSRHTQRQPYPRQTDIEPMDFLSECSVGSVKARLLDPSEYRRAARWVKQASEIRFQTREVNEWLAASLRFENDPHANDEGLHVDTLALPPGGVALLKLMSNWSRMQFLNRFKIYKLLAAIEAVNFQKAPFAVAISGGTSASAFDAGRCLQRVWLRLTERGLAAHPYYVVSDLVHRLQANRVPPQCIESGKRLQNELDDAFGSGQTLHCLFRVGKPAAVSPYAARLPLRYILCENT